jgi:hypothetical protein
MTTASEVKQKLSREQLAIVAREYHRRQKQRNNQTVDEACKQWIVSHKAGPMYWLRKCTKTENYQWKEQKLEAVAPFPYKPWPRDSGKLTQAMLDALPFSHDLMLDDPPDYLDIVMGYLLSTKLLNVPKTREMLTSWIVVGFITWFCQFFPATGWIAQSEDDLKAQGLISYANILYKNQPTWMKVEHPLSRGRADEGTKHRIEWGNGSWFMALPSGIRKTASRHPHGYFNDESAHQPAWKPTMNIVMPAVKQVINVSSVAPGDFADEALLA